MGVSHHASQFGFEQAVQDANDLFLVQTVHLSLLDDT
jgi:hypothetical protein